MNVCTIPAMPYHTLAPAEERVYLNAGSLYASYSPALINTVVSSSVAVCLWSPGIAGINHYVIPRGGSDRSLRCGSHALPMLLSRVIEMGATRDDLIAAVFGGATLSSEDHSALSRRNVAEAHEFLGKHEIPIVRLDVGGSAARRITFRTFDGSTIVRTL